MADFHLPDKLGNGDRHSCERHGRSAPTERDTVGRRDRRGGRPRKMRRGEAALGMPATGDYVSAHISVYKQQLCRVLYRAVLVEAFCRFVR